MAEYWTIQQAAANAELFAREFNNRQILLIGLGEPILKAPIGVEYEDRSFSPAKRYRKTGPNDSDWTEIKIISSASTDEVNQGVNDSKMITPKSLSERLSSFSAQLMGIPQPDIENNVSALLPLQASSNEQSALFTIQLMESVGRNVLPIEILGYGMQSSIENILGGNLGQMIVLRRGENTELSLVSNDHFKLSAAFTFNDLGRFDNITLQRLTPEIWAEVSRKKFT